MSEAFADSATQALPTADDVLFTTASPKAKAARQEAVLICSFHEDERPLRGVAGSLDWRLRGFLSNFIIAGSISGKAEEVIYVPLRRHGVLRHILLVGLGARSSRGQAMPRDEFGKRLLKKIESTVTALQFKKVMISQSSFPFLTEAQIEKAFADIDVEMVQ